jgi:hypothetical protein
LAVVVDTGVLYALADREDRAHRACQEAIAAEPEAIIIPAPVLPEVAYLVNRRRGAGAEGAFFRGLLDSDWAIEPTTDADLRRAVELLETYSSADIGFVDAATVAIAERLAVRRIYTLDRRDFSLIRPAHTPSFELLP